MTFVTTYYWNLLSTAIVFLGIAIALAVETLGYHYMHYGYFMSAYTAISVFLLVWYVIVYIGHSFDEIHHGYSGKQVPEPNRPKSHHHGVIDSIAIEHMWGGAHTIGPYYSWSCIKFVAISITLGLGWWFIATYGFNPDVTPFGVGLKGNRFQYTTLMMTFLNFFCSLLSFEVAFNYSSILNAANTYTVLTTDK